MAVPVTGTKINGKYFDYSSVEISIGGQIFINVKSVKYKHGLDPGKLRGTGAKVRGRTRGTYDADGGFEMYKEDYKRLKAVLAAKAIGGGYMTAEFGITCNYRELPDSDMCTDVLRGCRIVSEENSHSEGNDVLLVSVDLDIMEIITDGLSPVDKVGGAAAGAIGAAASAIL